MLCNQIISKRRKNKNTGQAIYLSSEWVYFFAIKLKYMFPKYTEWVVLKVECKMSNGFVA